MPVVLITGASRGLGLEFAKQLNKLNYKVFATSRNPDNATALCKVATVLPLDVTNESSIQALSSQINQPIDLLINNSGIMSRESLADVAQPTLVSQFIVNAAGPILVAQHLLSLIKQGTNPKIINITSRMGSVADNGSGGMYGYRASKSALNAMTKSLSIDVPEVVSIALHPGYIKTSMTDGKGDMDPDEAVTRMLKVIMEVDSTKTGHFLHRDGQVLPW